MECHSIEGQAMRMILAMAAVLLSLSTGLVEAALQLIRGCPHYKAGTFAAVMDSPVSR